MARLFGRKNKEKETINKNAEEIASYIAEKETNSPEELGKQASERAQEIVLKNSEADKISEISDEEKEEMKYLIKVLTQKLLKDENIPDEAAGEFLKSLIADDSEKDITTEVAVNIAKEAAPDLPDGTVAKIIDLEEVKPKDAEIMVEGIDDEELKETMQEKIDLEKLNDIYIECEAMSDKETVGEVKEIIRENKTDRAEEIIDKIVAKRIAYDVAEIGGFTMSRFLEIETPVRMLESDIPKKVTQEYDKIRENKRKHVPNEKDIKDMIIKQIAVDMATQYKKMPENKRTFVIPESKKLKNLSKEEQEYLIKEVESSLQLVKPKKYETQDLKNKLNGDFSKTEEIETLRSNLESIEDPKQKKNEAATFLKIFDKSEELSAQEKEKFFELLGMASDKIIEKMKDLRPSKQEEKKEAPDTDSDGR